jgi:hypothetical protein
MPNDNSNAIGNPTIRISPPMITQNQPNPQPIQPASPASPASPAREDVAESAARP